MRTASGGDLRKGPRSGSGPRGAWGNDCKLYRSDLVAIGAAIRRGWCPPKRVRTRLVRLILTQGIDSEWTRMTLSACNTIIQMAAQDQRREHAIVKELLSDRALLCCLLSDVRTRRTLWHNLPTLRLLILNGYGPPEAWTRMETETTSSDGTSD
jgi:hypothetical protein